MNCIAFLANFGWINISSKLNVLKAIFLIFSSNIVFFLLICFRHSIKICLADCSPHWHRHSDESNSDTFPECRNFLRPIFSIFIYTIRALAALLKPLYSFSIFLVSLGQIVYNSLPVFSCDQASPYSSSIFCSSASLMVPPALSSICFSAVYPKSHSLYFLFFLLTLLHSVASLAATSTFLFLFISIYTGI